MLSQAIAHGEVCVWRIGGDGEDVGMTGNNGCCVRLLLRAHPTMHYGRLCVETVFLCIEHVCSAEKGSVAFASTIHQSTYTWPRVLGESLRDVDVQNLAVLHAQKSF